MDWTGNEICYLKEVEFKLLLAGLGLKQWYGLFSEEDVTLAVCRQKEEVNRLLAAMYQNGLIDWKNGNAALRQPYARMFAAMLEKKRCVIMQLPGSAAPLCCCYLSETGVVVMNKSQREDVTVSMSEMSVEHWLGLIQDASDRLEEGECLELTCCSSENGQVYQKVRIKQEGIRARRIDWENGEQMIVHCFQEELPGKLGELLFSSVLDRKAQDNDIDRYLYTGSRS